MLAQRVLSTTTWFQWESIAYREGEEIYLTAPKLSFIFMLSESILNFLHILLRYSLTIQLIKFVFSSLNYTLNQKQFLEMFANLAKKTNKTDLHKYLHHVH